MHHYEQALAMFLFGRQEYQAPWHFAALCRWAWRYQILKLMLLEKNN
jgi:hypothetical protein